MAQNGGILGGLDFTTGKVDDGQTVVCLVRQDQKSCDRNNQAIKLNPNDADAYYNRRIARDNLGDKQGAIADYDQAIKINPNTKLRSKIAVSFPLLPLLQRAFGSFCYLLPLNATRY